VPAFVLEEAGFAVREVAARAVPAPLALPLFRDAEVAPVFFPPAELLFLLLPVPRLAAV
jgi:hypothetical protein